MHIVVIEYNFKIIKYLSLLIYLIIYSILLNKIVNCLRTLIFKIIYSILLNYLFSLFSCSRQLT